jgi:hypothetical protein
MALSNYLNKSKFYAISGLSSSEVNDSYVDSLIASINQMLDDSLGGLFQITSSQSAKYYMQNTPRIVLIGTWQKTNLTVKKGFGSYSSLSTLTENSDFRFLFTNNSKPRPGKNYPVIGIELFNNFLSSSKDYLQIEGSYGYSASVPASLMLDQRLYGIIKKACQSSQIDTESGGNGPISSATIDKVKTDFAGNSGGLMQSYITQDQAMYMITNLIDNIASDYDFSDLVPQVIG